VAEPKVYLFWDNSNIFISAKNVGEDREGKTLREAVRIHFMNLYRLAVASRPVGKAVVVGSIPPEQREVWDRMKQDTGIEPELYERGSQSGTEQGTDQCLQIHMRRALSDCKDDPQIAVLLTGDGSGYYVGSGFHADLERLSENGWGIEVVAWETSCARQLKEWAKSVGQFIRLEDYYATVTFTEEIRTATKLNLTSRPRAKPGTSLVKRVQENAERQSEEYKAKILQLQEELESRQRKKTRHERRVRHRDELHRRSQRRR
jgi:hypothetical protein